MRARSQDNSLSWARFVSDRADVGLAALIALALVLSLAGWEFAAEDAAARKVNTAAPGLYCQPITEEE